MSSPAILPLISGVDTASIEENRCHIDKLAGNFEWHWMLLGSINGYHWIPLDTINGYHWILSKRFQAVSRQTASYQLTQSHWHSLPQNQSASWEFHNFAHKKFLLEELYEEVLVGESHSRRLQRKVAGIYNLEFLISHRCELLQRLEQRCKSLSYEKASYFQCLQADCSEVRNLNFFKVL